MRRQILVIFVDLLQTVGIAAAIFILIYAFLFRLHQVFGHSMDPNFQDKEYVATDIISYRFRDPERGDVIVLKAPSDPTKDFIKRIIGLPNEKIKLQDSAIFINGKRLDERKYLDDSVKTYPGSFLKNNEELTIPADSYIVMGDNRGNSSDSREWGFLKRDAIIGHPVLSLWPPKAFGFIPDVNYVFP